MSRLLDLTNRLKAQAAWDMLTKSQRAAYTEFEERWRFPDRINLSGPQGSGKTFLGWVMARQNNARFYASPRVFERDSILYSPPIIIDNAPTTEKSLRELLSTVQLRQVESVLFITQTPIRLGFPVITLVHPSESDIATVYENCSKLQFYPSHFSNSKFSSHSPLAQESAESNYWSVIHSVL